MSNNGSLQHFGAFEADLATGELRRNGRTVRLQPQPFRVLALLLERQGELVTREEIRQKVWEDQGTSVDFEHGLNFAIKKIREALGDDADRPRYIETLPKRGYRFIAPLERNGDLSAQRETYLGTQERGQDAGAKHGQDARATARRWRAPVVGALAVMLAASAAAWYASGSRVRPPQIPAERQLTASPPEDRVWDATISPDGKFVAYVDQTGLYLRSIDSGETNPVSLPSELHSQIGQFRWLPGRGELVADVLTSRGWAIWVITVVGEAPPRLLYPSGDYAAISPDGRSIAFLNGDLPNVGKELLVGSINGEAPRKLVAAEDGQFVYSPAWSPDGQWIAYVKDSKSVQGSWTSAIEVRPAGGGPAKTLVVESSLPKASRLGESSGGLSWSPDWRLLFPVTEVAHFPTTQGKGSLWALRVEPQKGEAAGQPERLAQWVDFVPRDVSITADGKHLALLKERPWEDVYLAEFRPEGASLKPPRRFTLDDRGSSIDSWTRDSEAILFTSARNGKSQIFRQGLRESVAQIVAEGPAWCGWQSGSWLLYQESPPDAPGVQRLMRRPVGGGPPEIVLEEPADVELGYECSLNPDSPCVLSRHEGKQLIFYSLDPVRGKGKRLGTIEVGVPPGGESPPWQAVGEVGVPEGFAGGPQRSYGWGLSPDGSRVAFVEQDRYKGRVEVLSVKDGTWSEVLVEPGWGELSNVDWTVDGKGFIVTSWLPDSFNSSLLHVTLAGKVQPLLRNDRRQWFDGALPSRDGKYLALEAQTTDSNAWMLENF